MLRVNVEKRLGDKRAGEFTLDVSFTAENGFTVLLGASGSGKTTVLRLIAGILTPSRGTIKLDAQTFFDSAQNINLPIQNRRVGFVFQHYALFPNLTAVQNVAYGIQNDNRQAKINEAAEMLALFRVEHLSGRLPREMSGGEQQRVALARALAARPAIVLLDEPLSAVDAGTRAALLDEIEIAQRRADIPFIYVTHNAAEAERFGRRQIVLENGRVARPAI